LSQLVDLLLCVTFVQEVFEKSRIPTEVVNQMVDEPFLPEGGAVLVDAVMSAARKMCLVSGPVTLRCY